MKTRIRPGFFLSIGNEEPFFVQDGQCWRQIRRFSVLMEVDNIVLDGKYKQYAKK